MSQEYWIGFAIGFALSLIAGLLVGGYNSLVRLRSRVRVAWASLEVMLIRRADLAPHLSELVRSYAEHESKAFENIAQLHVEATHAATVAEKAAIDDELVEDIVSVLAVAESYPDLKASENFIKLQEQLVVIEDDIAKARLAYNERVRAYNARAETFPGKLVAGIGKFVPEAYFETGKTS